jgi:hypothetical protein
MLLVAVSCCSGETLPNIDLMVASGPSRAQALMDEINPAQAATTCRLVIEGGSNTTEIDMYGTSIARVQLACNGTVMRIAVHPVLAPFARHFTGVHVSSIPDIWDLADAENEATDECYSRSSAFLYLCGQPRVAFLRPRIVNLTYTSLTSRNQSAGIGALESVFDMKVHGVVGMVDPFVSQLDFSVLQMWGNLLYVKAGVINATLGISGGGVMLFDGTHFTNNENDLFGGAVKIVMGHAVFRDCVFMSNHAGKPSNSPHYVQSLDESLGSGFGGAVFGRVVSPGNDTVDVQTSATFLGCNVPRLHIYQQPGVARRCYCNDWCECIHHQLHLYG